MSFSEAVAPSTDEYRNLYVLLGSYCRAALLECTLGGSCRMFIGHAHLSPVSKSALGLHNYNFNLMASSIRQNWGRFLAQNLEKCPACNKRRCTLKVTDPLFHQMLNNQRQKKIEINASTREILEARKLKELTNIIELARRKLDVNQWFQYWQNQRVRHSFLNKFEKSENVEHVKQYEAPKDIIDSAIQCIDEQLNQLAVHLRAITVRYHAFRYCIYNNLISSIVMPRIASTDEINVIEKFVEPAQNNALKSELCEAYCNETINISIIVVILRTIVRQVISLSSHFPGTPRSKMLIQVSEHHKRLIHWQINDLTKLYRARTMQYSCFPELRLAAHQLLHGVTRTDSISALSWIVF